MMIKTHHLKCWPEYFGEVLAGRKLFEIRLNDRDFKVGDILLLQEYDPVNELYTMRRLEAKITYITDYAQQPNYVVMGIRKFKKCRICRGAGKFFSRRCPHCYGDGVVQ